MFWDWMNAQADAQVLGSAYLAKWKLPPLHRMPEISAGHPIAKAFRHSWPAAATIFEAENGIGGVM